GERGRGRLLHHVAELAGDLELAGAREARGLDEQHVATDGRPGEAGRNPRLVGPAADVRDEAALAQQLDDLLRAHDALARALALGVLARHLPAHRADLALEVPYARLARVALDDQLQRV